MNYLGSLSSYFTFTPRALLYRLSILLGSICYISLLNSVYTFHISPYFSYLGYTLHPAPDRFLWLSWITAWLPSTWLPIQLKRPSQVIYWFIYILVYVPSLLIPFLSLNVSPYQLLDLLLVLFAAFSTIQLIYFLPHINIQRLKIPKLVFWLLSFSLFSLFLLQIIQTFGLRFHIPSLLQVYDVRSEFKGVSSNPLIGYTTSWFGNIICPFLIAVGFIKRSPLFLIMGLCGQLIVFSVTGFKSVFFSSLLVFGLLLASSSKGKFFGLFIMWGATALICLTWLLDKLTDNIIYSSFFVRRMIITPGILTGWYYDFFSKHPQAHLGHSILEGFVDYPYDRSPPYLIGREYFGNEQTYANANLWADAYANFGFGGIIIYTSVLCFILWTVDNFLKNRSFSQLTLATLLLGLPALTLSNSALITSLLTHGILVAWLILLFLPRKLLSPESVSAKDNRKEVMSNTTSHRERVKVTHLTSKHEPFDTRIFLKECRSLAAHGYEVSLVVPYCKSETIDGVKIIGIPKAETRLSRMLRTTWRVFRAAVAENAALYHFHDPELIPIGLLLKLQGKKVLYDVHEDLPRQILSKHWVKPYFRHPLAFIMELVEQFGALVFDGIITVTSTIAKRFPSHKTVLVQNFPILDELISTNPIPYQERPPIIAYVGGITAIRGIKEMVEAMALVPDNLNAKLVLAGTFEPPSLEDEIKKLPGWNKVEFRGWQTRQKVADLLATSRLGLIVYHPEPNHINAQPNKLFEYMSAGIPIIASNFPLWREIITDANCGLLTDPLRPKDIAEAITQIITTPYESEDFGKQAAIYVKNRYNWSHEETILFKKYQELLD